MDHFSLVDGAMHCEGVPLSVIAEAVGTPVYVYSTATLKRHARVFREGLAGAGDVHLAYAIKANPNLAVLRVMADAEQIVADLYRRYTSDRESMPPAWAADSRGLDEDRHARRVADFVAGMTDRYALEEHRRLFKATPELR